MNNLLRTLGERKKKEGLGGSGAEMRALLEQMQSARAGARGAEGRARDEFQHALEGVVNELRAATMDNHDADAFLRPVSRADYPDYHARIKTPMDLGTIVRQLKKGEYSSKRALQDDLDLVWANCLAYNRAPGHPLRACAARLKRKADALLAHVTDARERHHPDLDAVFPRAPGTASSIGATGPVVARTRTRAPVSVSRPLRAAAAAVVVPPAAVSARGSGGLEAWKAGPALIREPGAMARVRALDALVDAADTSPTARTKAVEALRAHVPASMLPPVVAEVEDEEMDEDDAMLGDKRKAQRAPGDRPAKRTRTDSPAPVTEPVELWWAAQSSDLFLANAMPPHPHAADLPAFPPLPSIASSSALPAPEVPNKRRRPRAEPPPRENSLLAHMNANISTLRRVRAAHARFAAIVEAGAEPDDPSAPATLDGGGAGVAAPVAVRDGPWTLPAPPPGVDPPHGIDIGRQAADACLRWTSGKILAHVGFEGASRGALDALADVLAEHLAGAGRALRYYVDKHGARMSGEEAALHALFLGGVRAPAELEAYVREDVLRHGTRLAELEKKVHRSFAELVPPDAPGGADGLFGSDDEGAEGEGAGQYVLGDAFDALGEDFLGLRALGLPSGRIPRALLRARGGPAGQAHDPNAPPPLKYPPPPPFAPLAAADVTQQIGLLGAFYREKLARLAGPPPDAAPPPEPAPSETPAAPLPPIPGVVLPPIPGVSFPPPSTAAPAPAPPEPAIEFIPDDPVPLERSKVGPLGQIVNTKPPTTKKAKAAEARRAEAARAAGAGADARPPAAPAPAPIAIAPAPAGAVWVIGGEERKDTGAVKGEGKDGKGEGKEGGKPAPKKKKAPAVGPDGQATLPKKRGRPPKNALLAPPPGPPP